MTVAASGDDIGGLWIAPDVNTVLVSTGELAVADHPSMLVTPALGSCIGLALWDGFHRRGGLAHIMLPSPADTRMKGRSDRFASVAVERLIGLITSGVFASRLVAKIAGGAAMFGAETAEETIGTRNLAEVKRQLAIARIPVIAEDTGGKHARTMELYLDTGLVIVRSYRYGIREL